MDAVGQHLVHNGPSWEQWRAGNPAARRASSACETVLGTSGSTSTRMAAGSTSSMSAIASRAIASAWSSRLACVCTPLSSGTLMAHHRPDRLFLALCLS